jgi:enamine deaminase RidA (YjgF/YER057c/UK114 family)
VDGKVSGVEAHQFLNPPGLAPAVGFSHVALAAPGRIVFLAGQAAHQADGTLSAATLPDQFAAAARNLVAALEAAGGRPEHVVWLQIFTSDLAGYRASLKPIGAAYREVFGAHYPPMGLFGVTGLFDPGALVELMAVAVVPDEGQD